MKNIILIILLLAMKSVTAQISITSADMPAAGQTFVISNGQSFSGMNVVSTGANFNWDYSQLTYSSQESDSVLSPASTNSLAGLFFIDIAINPNRSNLASRDDNSILSLAGATGIFNFYFNSAASYTQSGFGATINGLPLPVAFNPHDIIYQFPLNYSDSINSSYNYAIDLTTVVGIYYGVAKTRVSVVDGWGSLTTPFGTFNALRIKSTITERDSIYIDSLHFGINTPPVITKEYKWLSAARGIPVLQINTGANDNVSQIKYQDSARSIGVEEVQNLVSPFSVFPNPAKGKCYLKYNLIKTSDVSISLLSSDGKLIYQKNILSHQQGENLIDFDFSQTHPAEGNYLIAIRAGSQVRVQAINVLTSDK